GAGDDGAGHRAGGAGDEVVARRVELAHQEGAAGLVVLDAV
ncbi:MAG: hypothetical protein AVDCRST_MAG93-2955, partial [uncultured Chloroflexia bacterium]